MTPDPSLNGTPRQPKYVCQCPGECPENDWCFVCGSRVRIVDTSPPPQEDQQQEMIA